MTATSQQFSFGSGLMFATRSDTALATPIQFGVVQDVSLDFSYTNKDLMGQYSLPVATARGAAKLTGKAKFARIDPAIFSDLFFGQARNLTASDEISAGEAATVPATSTYTVTAANGATFLDDLGVVYAATGLSFTRVTTSPTIGQYSVNLTTGVYTFAAADASAAVLLNYLYTSVTGNKLVITNQLMGPGPTFKLRLFNTYNGRNSIYEFNQVMSTKLSLDAKNEEWVVPEVDFSFFTDASNTLGTISFSQ